MILYDELLAAGAEMDHHESDLYVKSTPEVDAIIDKHYEADGGMLLRYKFISQIDRKPWWEIPFAYKPFWDSKELNSGN